eukprot:jgi/Galph1/3861/GphlegSOOS_G2532.1
MKVPCPGRSQVDWIKRQQRKNRKPVCRMTLEEVRKHCIPQDAWLVGFLTFLVQELLTEHGCWFLGCARQVYDVTEYIAYHPGGEEEICRGIGRDATPLFLETHPWVNVDLLLANCLIGYIAD